MKQKRTIPVAGLFGAVRDTVTGTLTDAGSRLGLRIGRPGKGRSGYGWPGKQELSHEEWKADAICRSLQERK